MFEILSLELECGKRLRNRKWHLLEEKSREILEYYQAKNQISGCETIIGRTDLGRNEIVGIIIEKIDSIKNSSYNGDGDFYARTRSEGKRFGAVMSRYQDQKV